MHKVLGQAYAAAAAAWRPPPWSMPSAHLPAVVSWGRGSCSTLHRCVFTHLIQRHCRA